MHRHNLLYFLIGMRENTKGFSALVGSFAGWYNFILLKSGMTDRAVLTSRRRDIGLSSIEIDKRSGMISVDYKGKRIKFSFGTGSQLDNAMRNIYEIFVQKQYDGLDVRNRRVVDVGANNGDSSIYFVLNGADKVYAYEPYPNSFRQAERNVRLNRMQDRIELNNEAVLSSVSSIVIDDKYDSVSNSMLEASAQGKRIRIVSLDRIVEERRLRNAVLKLDCEGSEYDIVIGAKDASLRRFAQIAIEYHFGYAGIVKKLRNCGFKVRYTRPKVGRNAETNGLKMNYGAIYAYR